MNFETASYATQRALWPTSGRHIMAHYDETSIVVYQAYNRYIGHYAATHGRFGGDFSFTRMSWVKPNFLWMMYRSGWGVKPNQEVTLAVRILREGFDEMLRQCVHSNFVAEVYGDQPTWKSRLRSSQVRLQWDPDHVPNGAKTERRAIQLGLRDEMLRLYGTEWVISIDDISDFVAEQRAHRGDAERLMIPVERPYPVTSEAVVAHLGLSTPPA
ncbi:MAG: DUF4291 domain-containing protein [Bradymonadia bacterium]